MSPSIAVVTGGNRGLGLETCRQLAQDKNTRVILAARRATSAQAAAEELGVECITLDLADIESIEGAAKTLRERWGQVDILVNNAAIALDGFDGEVARQTLAVNTWAPLALTEALQPIFSKGASVVMVSSGMGELSCLAPPLRRSFDRPDLTVAALRDLMEKFVLDVESGRYQREGWPRSAYSVSKVGLNALTRILARNLRAHDVAVNAVCPGWVRTDMGGPGASRGVEEGAASIVWAARVKCPTTGGFFRDGRAIPW